MKISLTPISRVLAQLNGCSLMCLSGSKVKMIMMMSMIIIIMITIMIL